MKMMRSRRGAGLIDVIATVSILATTGIIFATAFPAAFSCSRQASDYKIATTIAQEKLEELRAMEFESLTQPILFAAQVIDPTPTTSPYSFTGIENVDGRLHQGEGILEIRQKTAEMLEIRVTVSWEGKSSQERSVALTTLFADRRSRRGTNW